MKRFLLTALNMVIIHSAFATSILGGHISARYISGYTFEITITTYSKTSSLQSDRPTLDSVYFGDGTPAETFTRVSKTDIQNDVSVNVYIKNHTYALAGRFIIYFEVPNRNPDIYNIPHSVSVPFAVDMELVIDSLSCPASSPLFNGLPVFIGKSGKDFDESRSAYDPDKDSLSFTLVPCHGDNDLPIPGYFVPTGVSLNAFTGELTWPGNSVPFTTAYSFAVKVEKWRNGNSYGYTTDDFPLTFVLANDTDFNFFNTSSYSVDTRGFFVSSLLPTMTFNMLVQYFDSSSNYSTIDLFSEISSSVTTVISHNSLPETDLNLTWTPSQSDVRNDPYIFVFRGEPGEKDLTYVVYVNGIDSVSCNSLISVPEIPFDESNIHIFPNPVHDNLKIEINRNSNDALTYDFFDVTGRLLYEKKSFSDVENIRVNNFSSGIYFLKVENNSGIYCKKIFIY